MRLSGFNSADEMARWHPRTTEPVKTVWELATEHAAEGGACAKLVTPAVAQGTERWPAVILSGGNLPVRDWSVYEYLTFQAFNPGKTPVPLLIHVVAGDRTWDADAAVAPGAHTVRVPVVGAGRAADVRELHLFYNIPQESYTLFLDDLQLETGDLRAAVAALQRSCDDVARRLRPLRAPAGGLPAELKARRAEVRQLDGRLSRVAGDSAELTRWSREAASARTRLQELAAKVPAALLESRMAGGPWGYGWTHGVDKVLRQDRPFAGQIGGTPRVELAANEYEGVQLVLRSRRALRGVRVAVSDLAGRAGRIATRQVEVLPVGYVNTRKPPYAVDYVGWWPDPLLDFLPAFDLDANVWQPVWLDVHTTPDQEPGLYRGTITVAADDAPALRVPLEVRVWGFAVPTEYHQPLAVVFWDGTLRSVYSKDADEWAKYDAYCRGETDLTDLGAGEARRLADIRQQCHEMLLAHHLIPDSIYRGNPPRIDDVKRWKAAGARWFNILHVGNPGVKAGQPYPAAEKERILRTLDEYVPKLQAEGLLEMAYIYGFDEVSADQFAAVQDIYGEIKRRYPRIPLMTTAYDQSYGMKTGLDQYVDIWVPLTPVFGATSAQIAEARARGRHVWWYICCGPLHPHANWFVEYTAAEHRLVMGFMPFRFKTEGFLYYSLNLWQTNRTVTTADGKSAVQMIPYAEPVDRGPLTNSDGKSWTDFNGDGQIMYPGPNGPLSTIRMKCIRDGLEDYEYLWMLQRAVEDARAGKARVPRGWVERAEKALRVSPTLVRSLTEYTTDGQAVLDARRELAGLLAAAASTR